MRVAKFAALSFASPELANILTDKVALTKLMGEATVEKEATSKSLERLREDHGAENLAAWEARVYKIQEACRKCVEELRALALSDVETKLIRATEALQPLAGAKPNGGLWKEKVLEKPWSDVRKAAEPLIRSALAQQLSGAFKNMNKDCKLLFSESHAESFCLVDSKKNSFGHAR